LKEKFPSIKLAEWKEKESKGPITHCLFTPDCNSPNPNVTEESKAIDWNLIAASGSNAALMGCLRDLEYVISVSQGAISTIPKPISLSYRGITAVLNVASCETLSRC
jgi:hypothetical protein